LAQGLALKHFAEFPIKISGEAARRDFVLGDKPL
jgi:hypothetical protein